jgi:hypothetical protein
MIAYRMKIVIVIITAVVFAGCSMSADTKVAEQAVTNFHQMLDAGQIDAIYDASADDLKRVTTHERFVTFLGSVHGRLGNTKSSNEKKWFVNYNTSGKFVTLTYSTTYDGGNAVEEFVYRLQDGKALLAGYHIN